MGSIEVRFDQFAINSLNNTSPGCQRSCTGLFDSICRQLRDSAFTLN